MFRICSVSFEFVPDCSTPHGRKTTGDGDEAAGSLSESAALTLTLNNLSGEIYTCWAMIVTHHTNDCNPPYIISLSDYLHAAARLAVLVTCDTFAG